MKRSFQIGTAFVFCLISFAARGQSVLQVKDKAFLFKSGATKIGDVLSIYDTGGTVKGTARVKQAGKNQSVAEILTGSVSVGDQVGVGETDSSKISIGKEPPPSPSRFQFAAGLSYAILSSAKFSGTLSQGADYGFSAEGKSGTGGAISADVRFWLNDSYGLMTGFDYELERKIDAGLRYKLDDLPTIDSSDDKYQNLSVYLNFVFRFSTIYMPVGLNYSMVKYSSADASTATGSLGYQVGVGGMAMNHLALELFYRVSNFKFRTENASGTIKDFSTAPISSVFVSAKWVF